MTWISHPTPSYPSRLGPRGPDITEDLPPMDGDGDGDGDEEGDTPIEGLDESRFDEFEKNSFDEQDGLVEETLPVGELIDALPDDPGTTTLQTELDLDGCVQDFLEFPEEKPARTDDDEEGVLGDDTALGIRELRNLGVDDEQEGTTESLEAELDEGALPELGTDETEELASEVDIGEIELPEEVSMPAWGAAPWSPIDTPLIALPMRFIACARSYVAAVGEAAVLLPVEQSLETCKFLSLDGHEDVEFIAIGLVGATNERITLATRQRVMAASMGEHEVHWETDTRIVAHDDGLSHVEFGSDNQPFSYATTSQGKLLVSGDLGRTWRALDGVGKAVGLAIDQQGAAHVLTKTGEVLHWLTVDAQGRWESKPLADDTILLPKGSTPRLAVHGNTWLVALEDGRLFLSPDAGETWMRERIPPSILGVTIVPSQTGSFVVGAIYVESEDRSFLFDWHPKGPPHLIADLSPSVIIDPLEVDPAEGMGRVHHIVWDPERGCVWVAGNFGLGAWRPALPI